MGNSEPPSGAREANDIGFLVNGRKMNVTVWTGNDFAEVNDPPEPGDKHCPLNFFGGERCPEAFLWHPALLPDLSGAVLARLPHLGPHQGMDG